MSAPTLVASLHEYHDAMLKIDRINNTHYQYSVYVNGHQFVGNEQSHDDALQGALNRIDFHLGAE